MPPNTKTCHINIDADLVHGLIARQFPQWSNLPVDPILPGGWDNRSFRLGQDLVVRLPSAARYAPQANKEQHWLPLLGPTLPLPIPSPVAAGEPAMGYPWRWSINRWLTGKQANTENIIGMDRFARDLAHFLRSLQQVKTAKAPLAGAHNFHRGGPVATYDHDVRKAILGLAKFIDTRAATVVWEEAISSSWGRPGVWVHGDITATNLLARDGKLAAVIDFGSSGVGDPACDLTIAWTFFTCSGREVFKKEMAMDDDTWARARGWALWKALLLVHGDKSNSVALSKPWSTLREVLSNDLCQG